MGVDLYWYKLEPPNGAHIPAGCPKYLLGIIERYFGCPDPIISYKDVPKLQKIIELELEHDEPVKQEIKKIIDYCKGPDELIRIYPSY